MGVERRRAMRARAALTPVPGHFAAEQAWAAVTVVGAVLVVVWLLPSMWRTARRAHGGLITGEDNRYSTGKVIAVGWTILVAWMVVTEAYIAVKASSTTFADLLSGASDLYFVFLGGPYAAAAFAKASTQSKISQGTLSKTPAAAPTPLDVIADDNGNVDVYDFQYTLFNLLALLIVAFSFGSHPGHGLPDIPQFLAILAGGAALTYTVNKTVASSGPQITSVTPENARIGDTITIVGMQLFASAAGSALPTVTIGTVNATGVEIPLGTTNIVTATVAAAPAGTTPLSGKVDVVVTPPTGSPAVLREGVNIVADNPTIDSVKEQPFAAGDTIIVNGILLLTPGTPPGTATARGTPPGGLTAALKADSGPDWPIDFDGAYSDAVITLKIGDQPAGLPDPPSEIQTATLTLTCSGLSASSKVRYRRS